MGPGALSKGGLGDKKMQLWAGLEKGGFSGCWKQTSWELRDPMPLLILCRFYFCLVMGWKECNAGLVFRPLSQLSGAAVLCQRGSQRHTRQVSEDCLRWAPELENPSCWGQKRRVTCSSLCSLATAFSLQMGTGFYHLFGLEKKELQGIRIKISPQRNGPEHLPTWVCLVCKCTYMGVCI